MEIKTEKLEGILKNVKNDEEASHYVTNYLVEQYENFSSYINEYIGRHDLKVPDIIKRSNLSKNYVYNILNGERNPKRDKIIALGIGMGMDFDEINRGLKIAGEGILYAKNERDARIIIALNNDVKNVLELNLILEENGLEILK